MTREFNVGEYLFDTQYRRLYTIENINTINKSFLYSYSNDDGETKYSFWIDFDDIHLTKLMDSGRVIKITTEQERLAIQIKYSCAN
jgi:hypothetical protein